MFVEYLISFFAETVLWTFHHFFFEKVCILAESLDLVSIIISLDVDIRLIWMSYMWLLWLCVSLWRDDIARLQVISQRRRLTPHALLCKYNSHLLCNCSWQHLSGDIQLFVHSCVHLLFKVFLISISPWSVSNREYDSLKCSLVHDGWFRIMVPVGAQSITLRIFFFTEKNEDEHCTFPYLFFIYLSFWTFPFIWKKRVNRSCWIWTVHVVFLVE